jgi:acyl-CoA synthetase (AMP-forming)/AMP-acid ligase II
MIAGKASREAIRAAGAKPLLIRADGRRWTGLDLEKRIAGLAQALVRRGLKGRRIGVLYWNSPAAIEAHLAIEWIGGTRVPVDPGAPVVEANAVFAAARVAAVLTDEAHHGDLHAQTLVHDDDAPLAESGAFEEIEVSPDQTHLLYPRMAAQGELLAVPLSYANWAASIDVNVSLYRSGAYGPPLAADDRFLSAQQIIHGTGTLGTFPFLHMGLPQVILRQFNAAQAAEAILRHRLTATFFVPGMVTRLAETLAAAPRTLSPPLRRILYGGAPVEADAMRRAVDILGPVLVQLYGRYEGGWPLAILGIAEHCAGGQEESLLGRSCGKPIAQTEIKIRPVSGQAPGFGELCVRNEMVVREFADPDGWCGLGDLARIDEQGYLYLAGRLDGMINTGSYHVYPKEVVEALTSIPGVREALVCGEPDPTWGQAVTAYIVAESDAGEDLLERAREGLQGRLARYKIPKRFHLVGSLDEVP